ncbi:GNAT family N-acetyltransferase [Flagellimonas sp. 389]|uniref:GNAT family N-acetyltransferase n=1 Tax=Flagellimonas sp. 389 TaxID=2835862 RepID=UPI001BD3DBC0|nr:GNAT family N-acetyltransferase [Flagellimonas sp. 389]MBS9462918.1 GNAT family N-acetyltransferase [Flagellimonas sp. 389]
MDNQNFRTERLLIRPTVMEDAEFIFALMNTPKWIQYIGDRQIRTDKDAENYIKKNMIPQLERLGYSNYTVIRKTDNVKIGTCGLYDREGLEGIDLGFAFLPKYERKGYAFEASQALVDKTKKQFEIDYLSAITVPDNIASQKLLEKLGFEFFKTTQLKGSELFVYKIILNGEH